MAHLIRHDRRDAPANEGASTASSTTSSASSVSSDYSPRSSQTESLRNETVLNLFDCGDRASDRPSLDSDGEACMYDSYDSSGEGGSSGGASSRYATYTSESPLLVSSRAGSPGPDPWEGYLGHRSRNRSRHASGTTTPNLSSYEKESSEYYQTHYSQTTALLNKLGGIAPPENSPLGSPVLQHQKRRPGWWARRAEKRAWAATHNDPSKHKYAKSRGHRQRSCLSLFWSALLRQPWVPTQPLTILFFILLFGCFAATVTTFLTHVLSNDKQPLPWRTFCQNQREFPHELADSLAPVNVFVGVFSVDAAYERRQLIRSTYARLSKPVDPSTGQPAQNVQVKFILGRPRPSHARRVALEMETFNDVVVLDVKENMNRGKTHAFFRWASENATVPVYFSADRHRQVQAGFQRVDYVVKADDDTFLVLSELERHLRVTPRQRTYWGYLVRNLFMAGEVYALSSDLVDYVASYPPILAHSTGAEDKKVSKWMRMHPEAARINWITERCWVYDHPKAGTTYSHGFLFPDEVERIRLEGRRGLSDEEKVSRGDLFSQAYSTVSRWKTDYQKPADELTIEEEVEALIEGGGRWASTGWKSSDPRQPVRADLLLFNSRDHRLVRPDRGFADHSVEDVLDLKPGAPDRSSEDLPIAKSTRFSKDLFRRPEDVAVMRVERSKLQQDSSDTEGPLDVHNAVTPDLDGDDEDLGAPEVLPPAQSAPRASNQTRADGQLRLPPATHYSLPSSPADRLLPPATLRLDPQTLDVRHQRMLGRQHGGTVAVHYLKRNEWFYETSLALLGRHRTWDSGIEAPVSQPNADDHRYGTTTSYEVASMPVWRGVGKVEIIPPFWGGARMYGSPMVRHDGMIVEGRPGHRSRHDNEFGSLRGTPKMGFAVESSDSTSDGRLSTSTSAPSNSSPENGARLSDTTNTEVTEEDLFVIDNGHLVKD